MFPTQITYLRPTSLDQAIEMLDEHGEDAKLLAGGHSLLPAMKLRLAQPRVLIDITCIAELRGIRPTESGFAIGALATHAELEYSALLREGCPLLGAAAAVVGDLQVRNHGTLGGSLAHADPAADWPAAMLALDATFALAGRSGRRTLPAAEFFLDLFQTALQPDEILCEIRVPRAPVGTYVKTRQKASGFALAGSAAVVDPDGGVRIAISGVAAVPYRAQRVEAELIGQSLTAENIAHAGRYAAEGVEPLEDIHATAEYRAHLACVNTTRALTSLIGPMAGAAH